MSGFVALHRVLHGTLHGMLLAAMFALAVSPAAARAQHAAGILFEVDGSTPARGVVVRATDVRSGRVTASVRTGDDGAFRILVGRDSTRLDALRIGSRPERLLELRATADVQNLRFTLRTEPIELPPVGTLRRSRCGTTSPESARLAATLFEQALTVLAAELASDSSNVVHTRWRRIALTSDEQGELANRVSDSTGIAIGGPASREVSELFQRGFFATDRDQREWYYAPSAGFFLNERFLRDYCLFLEGDNAGAADEVGVGFHAARRRGVSQLAGTMWFKREGLQLDRITFHYDGLQREALEGKPGGVIEYAPLPDGRWIATRWEVRMPQLKRVVIGRRPSGQGRATVTEEILLDGIHTYTGEVVALSSHGALRFSSAAPLVVEERPTLRFACSASGGGSEVQGEVAIPSSLSGELSLAWRLADPTGQGRAMPGPSGSVRVGADGKFLLCGLPRGAALALSLVRGGSAADGDDAARTLTFATLRLPQDRRLGFLRLLLPAT